MRILAPELIAAGNRLVPAAVADALGIPMAQGRREYGRSLAAEMVQDQPLSSRLRAGITDDMDPRRAEQEPATPPRNPEM
jgi:hypothetical protein